MSSRTYPMSFSTRFGPQHYPQLLVFDEPFGFRIRHIEVVPDVHNAGPRFQSGRWKPPTQPAGVGFVENVRYLSGRKSLPQDTKFVWSPPGLQFYGNLPKQSVFPMQPDDVRWYEPHKSATLFWATDSQTFMHVPFDCTLQDVEDPTQDDSEYEDDQRRINSRTEGNRQGTPTPTSSREGQQTRHTWRRLRFFHEYREHDQAPMSLAQYHGGNTEIDGKLPERWDNTLLPPAHRPQHDCLQDCQLAGDLPILLGLIAACHSNKNAAIWAIATWFPPSKGTTHWGAATASAQPSQPMQTCNQRHRRGMVIETFYDRRRENSKENLEAWESGKKGPIIT